MEENNNIFPIFDQLVSRQEKSRFLNQKPAAFWLTGLSGSGKSTIAKVVERQLFQKGFFVQILDGDNIRSGINSNLGFSLEDRQENIRRIAEITKLYLSSGIVTICTFVSPTRLIRETAKHIIGESDFNEVFIKSSVAACEKRDPKGLYVKARNGQIKGFTGIDSPYETPENPALIIDTEKLNEQASVERLLNFIIPVISHI